jgi:hypothetical protein
MEIKYNLGNYSQAEAYKKIDTFLDGLVKEHSDIVSNPNKKWNPEKNRMDFEFEAKGYNISGNIKLQGKELILDGKLPWAVKMFSGKIEKMVVTQLDKLFP